MHVHYILASIFVKEVNENITIDKESMNWWFQMQYKYNFSQTMFQHNDDYLPYSKCYKNCQSYQFRTIIIAGDLFHPFHWWIQKRVYTQVISEQFHPMQISYSEMDVFTLRDMKILWLILFSK